MQAKNIQASTNIQWCIFPTPEDVAIAARDEILQQAQIAIENHNEFRIVLAGGSASKQIYRLLAKEPIDWKRWQLYLGDERCRPIGDAERNSKMIKKTLLNNCSIPEKNIHFIPAELGAEIAAQQYAETIKNALPFDLVMLGMGEDGHTASLFPHHTHNSQESVHAVFDAPKPPPERVSLSLNSLNNNQACLIITTGASKKAAIKHWKAGQNLPISKISSIGKTKILTDVIAMPEA